ncbi:hypothetical protein SAMN03159343_0734 [Klenkia marina]|uniref:Uncharacterized protein n=1 Tax=Klenkia marina TaxID=1960309 RepID=A0A1G4XEH3_9ACTN|nr:hypothetical protein [Klenkia marina]SCX39663.1 hypothetical protein SAMN03159343_0734 [Klenkia marina]
MTADRDRATADRAAADLAALDADRAALADRVAPPRWFGPALGVLLFLFISSNAFDSPYVTGPALLVFGLGVALLVRAYRGRTGVWAYTPPKQLAGWAAFVVLVLVPAYVLDRPWAFLVAGAVLGVAVALLSHHWTRTWQRELREGV